MNNHRAILFDLDGTLVDTAPDLTMAVNAVRNERSLAPISVEALRPHVSGGSPAMLKMALDIDPSHHEYQETRKQFIHHYQKHTADASQAFAGIHELINELQVNATPWGIVTNKPENLTHLLLSEGLFSCWKPKIIIGGDTLAEKKPHPMPVYSAASALGFECHECLMVGDSIIDMVAGKEAGVTTALAIYGYPAGLSKEEEKNYVDIKLNNPQDILQYLEGF